MEAKITELAHKPPHYTIFFANTPMQRPVRHEVEVGVSVQEALRRISERHWQDVSLEINGVPTLKDDWEDTFPIEGDLLVAVISPQGIEIGIIGAAIIAAVVGAVVGYFLFKFFGPDEPNPDNQSDESLNRITGDSNSARRYSPVAGVLGKRMVTPAYAANPYTETRGDDEWYKILLCVGTGPLEIERDSNNLPNIKVGDTPINLFPSSEYRVAALDHFYFKGGGAVDAIRDIWPADVEQSGLAFTMKTGEDFSPSSVPLQGARQFSADYTLPRGLYSMDNEGKYRDRTVKWMYQYQPEEGGEWVYVAKVYDSSVSGAVVREGNGYRIVSSNIIPPSDIIRVQDDTIWFKGEHGDVASVVVTSRRSVPRRFSFRHDLVNTSGQFISDVAPQRNVAVRSKKLSPPETPDDNKLQDELQWIAVRGERPVSRDQFLRSVGFNRPPIDVNGKQVENFKPVLIALEIKGTDNFNGMLNNINVNVRQCVPSNWNDDWRDWPDLPLTTTENPSDAYRWIMQGPLQVSPVSNERLDLDGLAEWKSFCNSQQPFPPYRVSQTLNEESTVLKLLSQTAFAGRAEFAFVDGKYGVVIKEKKDYPVQVFTPKNSWGFSSARQYPEVVDGLKFEWENEEADYQKDEGLFEDPRVVSGSRPMVGKQSTVEYSNIPSHDLAYRHTRFRFFENQLQREAFKLTTDIEGLVCQRGDKVLVQDDIIDVGLGAGRIVTVSANNSFKGDENIDATLHNQLGIVFRSRSGEVYDAITASYNSVTGLFETVSPVPVDIGVGDFYVYGELGKETLECVVQQIEYKEDFSVELTLANYDETIFTADSNTIPVFNTGLTTRIDFRPPSAPVLDLQDAGLDLERGFAFINVDYVSSEEQPVQSVTLQMRSCGEDENIEDVYPEDNDGWEAVDVISEGEKIFRASPIERGEHYQFRARSRGVSLLYSPWSGISNILTVGRDIPPDDITGLTLTPTDEGLRLSWDESTDPNLRVYEVRSDKNAGNLNGLVSRTADLKVSLGYPLGGVTFYVYALTVYGVYSVDSEGVLYIAPVTPPPRNFNSRSIDNTVLLEWTPPIAPPYPITHYEVRRTFPNNSEGWDNATMLGTFSGTFAVVPEQTDGLYIYYIKSVDAAGGTSESVSLRLYVDNPPDFVLRSDGFLDLSLATTESVGVVLGGGITWDTEEVFFDSQTVLWSDDAEFQGWLPVFPERTYLERVHRVIEEDLSKPVNDILFMDSETITMDSEEVFWQDGGVATKRDKVNAGWTRWLHPTKDVLNCDTTDPGNCSNPAYIEKIVDFTQEEGQVFPGTRVTVQETIRGIEPVVVSRIMLSASNDGVNWDQSAEGRQAFFLDFRYIRVRIFFDTPTLEGSPQYRKALSVLERVRLRLDVKQKTQQGVRNVISTDIGGTRVNLEDFLDVESIVATVEGEDTAFPVVVFEDVFEANEFYIKVFDNNGNRIDAKVSWIARGV